MLSDKIRNAKEGPPQNNFWRWPSNFRQVVSFFRALFLPVLLLLSSPSLHEPSGRRLGPFLIPLTVVSSHKQGEMDRQRLVTLLQESQIRKFTSPLQSLESIDLLRDC